MKISVVVRCYNEEQHIARLLEGVLQQTIEDVEIILVDSGSTDGTLEVASRYPVKLVSITPEEFSFGRSLNRGCAAATGDLIAVASAHVYPVYTDWLEKLTAPLRKPWTALVYGKQRGNSTTKYSEHRIFKHWFPEISNPAQEHPFCNNANAAIPRALWLELPYDETLTGLEDLDWAKRALALGHRVAYCAEAEIIHVHDETPERIYNRYRREAIALKRIFPEEHFHLWDFFRLFTSNVTSDWYHAVQEGVLWGRIREITSFRFMQFWGTYRGFRSYTPVDSLLKQAFYYPPERRRAGVRAGNRPDAERVDYPRKLCSELKSRRRRRPVSSL